MSNDAVMAEFGISKYLPLIVFLGWIWFADAGIFNLNFTCANYNPPYLSSVGNPFHHCSGSSSLSPKYCTSGCQDSPSYVVAQLPVRDQQCVANWEYNVDYLMKAEWRGQIHSCYEQACPPPDYQGYGQYLCDASKYRLINSIKFGFPIGTRCNFSCPLLPGSQNVIECQPHDYTIPFNTWFARNFEAKWDLVATSCPHSSCPSLASATTATYTCTSLNNFQSSCSFDCAGNSMVSHMNSSVCIVNSVGVSEWRPAPPSCTAHSLVCATLVTDYNAGHFKWTCTNNYLGGSECTLSCVSHYTLEGPATVKCSRDASGSAVWRAIGHADGDLPFCQELLCPDPRTFHRASIISCNSTHWDEIDSLCEFTCPTGTTTATDNFKMICKSDPLWHVSGGAHFVILNDPCNYVACPTITASGLSPNLHVHCTGYFYGSECMFTCSSGLVPSGDKRWAQCKSDGSWDIAIPTCVSPPAAVDPKIIRNPVLTADKGDFKLLFYNDPLTWDDAEAFCQENGGTLAMPKDYETHKLLAENMKTAYVSGQQGVWVGMNDKVTEGTWKFNDGSAVNPPELYAMPAGNTFPVYERNVSVDDQWWFLWGRRQSCERDDCVNLCQSINGILPNIASQEINDAISGHINDLNNIWLASGRILVSPRGFGEYFTGVTATNKNSFVLDSGQDIYIYEDWYTNNGFPIPPVRSNYAPYQNWDPGEPNGFDDGELCVTINTAGAWTDDYCWKKLSLLCEKGPYAFERWHMRGTYKAEPNNHKGIENCGGYMVQLDTPMWNDFDCVRRFPYVCERRKMCNGIDPSTLGVTTYTCSSANDIDSQCNFSCPAGKQLPNAISTIWCRDPDGDGQGSWTDPIPICYDVSCPSVTRAQVTDDTFITCLYGWRCSFTCDTGTTMMGNTNVITCEDPHGSGIGRWSDPIPFCMPINCTGLDTTNLSPRTIITCTDGIHSGSDCAFSCPSGMKLDTAMTVKRCRDTDNDGVGEWDTTIMPNCSDIMCSVIDWKVIPRGLSVICTKANYWSSKCNFSCPVGEYMAGKVSDMTCQDRNNDGSGEWSVAMPLCEKIKCLAEDLIMDDGLLNCTDSNFYNSICNFSCNGGFRLYGPSAVRCIFVEKDEVGKWNESFPECEVYVFIPPGDCPVITSPPAGSISCTNGASYGSQCYFSCNINYALFGADATDCQRRANMSGQWSNMLPTCNVYTGECNPLMLDPVNGEVSCDGKKYVGSTCVFSCATEYHVRGSSTITCDDNDHDGVGHWSSNAPICFPDVVKCNPINPSFGAVMSCSNGEIKGSSCQFVCGARDILIGHSSLYCNDDDDDGIGTWTHNAPTCEELTCDIITPGNFKAPMDFTCSDYNYGYSKCEFKCLDKYRLVGITEVTCESVNNTARAQWSSLLPDCLFITCPFNATMFHNDLTYTCSDDDRLDSVCDYQCSPGMKLDPNHPSLTCQDLDNDGFGSWDKSTPSCEYVYCNDMGSLVTADVNFHCTIANRAFSKCTFDCVLGMKIDGPVTSVTCNDVSGVGHWSDTIPTCSPILCPPITFATLPSRSHVTFSCSDHNKFGSICAFACPRPTEYHPDSPTRTECVDLDSDDRGEWSEPILECNYVCKPPLIAPVDGYYSCSDLNFEDSECAFQCKPGFSLSHVNMVVCKLNSVGSTGEWKGVEPTCEVFEYICPELVVFQLSQETQYTCTRENKRGSRCTFSCPDDMELDNSRTIIECQDINIDGIGEWSFKPPKCIRTSCPSHTPRIKHGTVACTEQNEIGSVCSFDCKIGYDLKPPYGIFCKGNGFWNASAPICSATKCLPDLRELFGTSAMCLGGNDPGAECDVKCSHKSTRYGEMVKFLCADIRSYEGAGFWNTDLITCAGCATGLIDVMFLLDGSTNWPIWEFVDMRDWVPTALQKIRVGINEGAMWVSVAVFGGTQKRCNEAYTFPRFQLKLKLSFRRLEHIQREMREIGLVGGCSHLGSALKSAMQYLNSNRRPHVTSMIVLLLGGSSFDLVQEPLIKIDGSGIAILGVGYGKDAVDFLKQYGIQSFDALSVEDYKEITVPFLSFMVKYDCRGQSRCAGPIENGTVTCILREKGPASEICTIHCDKLHQLVGEEKALCGDINDDGKMEWLSPHGICKSVTCPTFKLQHGSYECTDENHFLSTCQFQCSGWPYVLVGMSEIICGDPNEDGIGEWHSAPPECVQDLPCKPKLVAPLHGSMFCTKGNKFGSKCSFTCDSEYVMLGHGSVICQDAGKSGEAAWQHPPPICQGCGGTNCLRDIIVLLDGSGSIPQRDFRLAKDWIVEVLRDIQGEIDTGRTVVGVIQYSGYSLFSCDSKSLTEQHMIEVELTRLPFSTLKKKIDKIDSLHGCTATGFAIASGTQHFKALGRQRSHKSLMILTDGRSHDDMILHAEEAKLEEIKIIVVAIGTFNMDQLRAISTHLIRAESYLGLESVLDEVQAEIASDYLERDCGCFLHHDFIVYSITIAAALWDL